MGLLVLPKDRRLYERLATDLEANIYFGEGYCERNGRLLNISEHGFLFETSADSFVLPERGAKVMLEFVDDYELAHKAISVLMQEYALVRYIRVCDGRAYIGCMLQSETYRHYVLDQQLLRYMDVIAFGRVVNG